MDSIPVFSLMNYLTNCPDPWRQVDFDIYKMVQCFKGEKINGYFDITVGGRPKKITKNNQEEFAGTLCRILWSQIKGEFSSGQTVTIIPVPNSGAKVGLTDSFRTLVLANQIAAASNGVADVLPSLLWTSDKKKAHLGGLRDPDVLYELLSVQSQTARRIVLFDDVLTSGGHLVASTRKLLDAKQYPLACLTLARTVHTQEPKAISWRRSELSLKRFEYEF